MNKRSIAITILITLVVGFVMIISNTSDAIFESAKTYYQIYLNGKELGMIENSEKIICTY